MLKSISIGLDLLMTMFIAAVAASFLFWMMDESPPQRIVSNNVISQPSIQDRKLAIEWSVERSRIYPTTVYRYIINNEGKIIDVGTSSYVPSRRKESFITIDYLPKSIEPGEWELRTDFMTRCNPIKVVHNPSAPAKFTIIDQKTEDRK